MIHNTSIRTNVLAAVACLLWATPFVFVKITLEHLPPLTIAGLRFLLAGLIQLPFCRKSPFHLLKTAPKTVVLVSLFQTILLYAGFFYALTLVRGAQAAIIVGSGPLISAVAAHLTMHDDKLNRRTLQSIALGGAGLIIISLASKPWNPVGIREFSGMLILFGSSVVSAAGNIVVAKKRGALSAIELNSMQMLLGGAVLLIWALPFEGVPNLILPIRFYGALLWLAFVSAAGFGIWFHLLSREKVSKLNIWKFLVPLAGATLSWILIPGEHPDLPTLAGMVLIIFGIIHSQRIPANG
ncbi:DMT family transporter [Tichowtungia aerotolerans]|uniref:EamA family transporter n=1 Tax=Tichowtungia aerotolerans TaxID=2697043 RepID=A0A6P1M3Z8_9BACT|nr:EamA family transporter [Tichowtungia aerotolerans]QHI68567.1 EamA family transporter [Tichowtungia aerotolerans]